MKKKNLQNQALIGDHEIIDKDMNLLKVCKSICKIIVSSIKQSIIGSGFFIKFYQGIKP